ncbi:hypothetical protein [Streptoalloteichus hindustanus]|uniref:Immunity protein 50 n=1 Tax=Streptoalloteichus hindustanus TaxID=2017 RepID=A0A1M5BBC3_STRHI|nr:hypothetical protein [Streptoalloteichus hindustanus]SHF39814.1 hypothetical protein SAMN05444320_103493 [Streptoalloteichus hindustanus]
MEVGFVGLDRWNFDSEIIGCAGTALGFVDLHNSCDIMRVEFGLGLSVPSLFLHFETIAARERFALAFREVSTMEASQKDASPDDGQVFHGLDYWYDIERDTALFRVDLEMMELRFAAREVAFVV